MTTIEYDKYNKVYILDNGFTMMVLTAEELKDLYGFVLEEESKRDRR